MFERSGTAKSRFIPRYFKRRMSTTGRFDFSNTSLSTFRYLERRESLMDIKCNMFRLPKKGCHLKETPDIHVNDILRLAAPRRSRKETYTSMIFFPSWPGSKGSFLCIYSLQYRFIKINVLLGTNYDKQCISVNMEMKI